MAKPKLVDRVHEFGAALARVLRLLPTDDPLHRSGRKRDVASFLFEVRVLTELLVALNRIGRIDVVRRGRYIVLARAPANKSSKSYFEVTVQNRTVHLCPGVKVVDRHGSEQAPDLTLQHPDSGESPTFRHVLAMWDAKLRGESGRPDASALTKPEVAEFMYMLDVLEVPSPGKSREALAGWPAAFEVSALITNGRRSAHTDALLYEKGFSETEAFVDAQTACHPTYAEHIAASVMRT
jgi:hypothetical protein